MEQGRPLRLSRPARGWGSCMLPPVNSSKMSEDRSRGAGRSQNQVALISAARRLRESGATLVLDGHCVLRRAPGIHERLPIDVFHALNCSSILLIRSPVSVLLERLHARQDMSWTEAELADFSKAEDVHSAEEAEVLGIPLKFFDSPTIQEVEAWLNRLSKGASFSRE